MSIEGRGFLDVMLKRDPPVLRCETYNVHTKKDAVFSETKDEDEEIARGRGISLEWSSLAFRDESIRKSRPSSHLQFLPQKSIKSPRGCHIVYGHTKRRSITTLQ